MSLTKRKIKAFMHDEKAGNAEYLKAAKKAKLKGHKTKFRMMARDEKRHRRMLEAMEDTY